jgi:hypothetical protein
MLSVGEADALTCGYAEDQEGSENTEQDQNEKDKEDGDEDGNHDLILSAGQP